MLFRGYVKTINKECTMAFKGVSDSKLLTLEEAEKLEEYAGILAKDIVLIDIDDYDQSEILMDIVEDLQLRCRVVQTTRGKHFYFKNVINIKGEYLFDKAVIGAKLACGLTADIKLGCKNGYSIVKFKDKKREIIYDIFEDEEYQNAPKWLLPVNSKIDFTNLEEGDGRNDTLFKYILTLQSADFSKKEVRECLSIINKYVMKDSLSDRELDVIMRDDAFKKEMFFGEKGTFLFDKFANYLMNNASIKKIHDTLHIFKNGVYVNGNDYIEKAMINRIPFLKAAHRVEVLKYLALIVPEAKMSEANLIAFNNGIYDITQDSLMPFNEEVIITNKIPYEFNDNVYSEIADKTLNKLACGNKEIRMLLEECIGYCFYRRNELRKSFMLIGDKANGKSTFLDMINNLLGENNISTLDLNEIGDKFLTAELSGKLANIGDDIDDKYVGRTGVFKKLVSGSKIEAQKKGQDPFRLTPYCKFLFSANDIPRFKDKTGAVMDRLVIIPFKAKFSKSDPDFDPYIKYKLQSEEVMEYLIKIGLEGLKRVLENNSFTISDEIKKELKEFDEKNNPILLFFKEITEDDVVNKVAKDLYLRYDLWCGENGFQSLGYLEFTKAVKNKYDVDIAPRKIADKSVRCYVK